MSMGKIDFQAVRKTREALDRIEQEHPELVDGAPPRDELMRQWEKSQGERSVQETCSLEEAAAFLGVQKGIIEKAIQEALEQLGLKHPKLAGKETSAAKLANQWEGAMKGLLMRERIVFTIEEAAEVLCVHKDTVRRAIKAGKLKAARLRKGYRISRPDLTEYYRTLGGGELFGEKTE